MDKELKPLFIKGGAGGPGRPRKKPSTKQMLDELKQEALKYLSDLMHSDDKETAIRACFEIIKFAISEEQNSKSEISNLPSLDEFLKYVSSSQSNPSAETAQRVTILGKPFFEYCR